MIPFSHTGQYVGRASANETFLTISPAITEDMFALGLPPTVWAKMHKQQRIEFAREHDGEYSKT